MRIYILKRDFWEYPHWKKGTMFGFESDTGIVWGMKDKETTNSYPLRTPLAGYLWMLLTEKGLFKEIKYTHSSQEGKG
jgi:hypothetical protein